MDRLRALRSRFGAAPVEADFNTAQLPPESARPAFHMVREGGRDQVARMIEGQGWKDFEPPMPAVFCRLACQASGLIVDVGANTGFYALLAAAASRRAQVLAFEPDPQALGILRRNIAFNRLDHRIDVAEVALSDRAGRAMLYVPTKLHSLVETSSSLEANFKPAHAATLPVATTTLDAFLVANRRRVDLIKIDVEGHEAPVLHGCARIVTRHQPVLFVEVLRGADFARLDAFLAAHDYVDVPLLPDAALVPERCVRFHEATFNHAFVPRKKCLLF